MASLLVHIPMSPASAASSPKPPSAALMKTSLARAAAADEAAQDGLCEDDDYDDDSFAPTYRPLSNLPTPPPSNQTSAVQSPGPRDDDELASCFFGPAMHLVNMFPPAASLATPSVVLVQAMLTRAQLPLDTVALAVCILDALDKRFSRTWRLTCPLPTVPGLGDGGDAGPTEPSVFLSKRHTIGGPGVFSAATPTGAGSWHNSSASLSSFASSARLIDAVSPEIIILGALVIAAKFTDDNQSGHPPAHYCQAWGGSIEAEDGAASSPLWTGAQLAATERCIMQSLGYRILPLLDADLLADARADMHRAGVHAMRKQRRREQQQQKQQRGQGEENQATEKPSQDDQDKDSTGGDKMLCRHHTASRSECLVRYP